MSDIVEIVRRVLHGQSPNYFIFPNASAFIAEGLDPNEVADILDAMEKSGEIERERILVERSENEDNGDSGALTIGGGYRMKRNG